MRRRAGLALAVAVLWAPTPAAAVPRFAAQQAAACSLCHVNPTGGGPRNAYGRGVFARNVLPASWGGAFDGLPIVDPTLGEHVAVGADVRAAYLHAVPGAGSAAAQRLDESGSFFLMQGDVYVTAELPPYLALVLDHGAYGSQEIFALGRLGPVSLKAGKFMPAYGWRLTDHTAAVREPLGFGPRSKDAGVALLLDTRDHSVELGAFNGAGSEALIDTDLRPAFSARAESRARLGPLAVRLGASGYLNTSGGGPTRQQMQRFGGFGAVGLGKLTWVFEVDAARDHTEGKTTRAYVAYHELSLVAARGLQVAATYDFLDPDVQLSANAVHRVGVSLNLFPLPHAEVEVVGRRTLASAGDPRRGLLEGVVILHGYL